MSDVSNIALSFKKQKNNYLLTVCTVIFIYFVLNFRLEIGVQSVYEDIARDTNRGHTVKAVCENFNLAKDAGYKVIVYLWLLL